MLTIIMSLLPCSTFTSGFTSSLTSSLTGSFIGIEVSGPRSGPRGCLCSIKVSVVRGVPAHFKSP